MTGILIELLLSWVLLYFFDQSNLSVLGFKPTQNSVFNLILGFITAVLFCAICYYSSLGLAGNHYVVNKNFTAADFAKSSGWVMVSVLYEELIFRGALLYIAIKKLGINRACIISAIAFGIYHWFSYGVLGNPLQMFIVFMMTGIFGLMFAYAFAKTKSLYLPTGLHFGGNLANIVIFSKGPLGQQLLIPDGNKKLEGILSLIVFIIQIIGLPIFTYFYLRKLERKNSLKNAPIVKEQS